MNCLQGRVLTPSQPAAVMDVTTRVQPAYRTLWRHSQALQVPALLFRSAGCLATSPAPQALGSQRARLSDLPEWSAESRLSAAVSTSEPETASQVRNQRLMTKRSAGSSSSSNMPFFCTSNHVHTAHGRSARLFTVPALQAHLRPIAILRKVMGS